MILDADARYLMQDAGCKMQDAGCKMQIKERGAKIKTVLLLTLGHGTNYSRMDHVKGCDGKTV